MVGDSQTLLVFQSLPAMNRALRGHRTWTLFSTTTILICLHAFDPYFSRNTCMTSPQKMNVHEDVKTSVFLCFPRQNPRFSCRCSVVPMISPRRSLGGVSFEEGISWVHIWYKQGEVYQVYTVYQWNIIYVYIYIVSGIDIPHTYYDMDDYYIMIQVWLIWYVSLETHATQVGCFCYI